MKTECFIDACVQMRQSLEMMIVSYIDRCQFLPDLTNMFWIACEVIQKVDQSLPWRIAGNGQQSDTK